MAKCPKCRNESWVAEKSFFRCKICSMLVNVVGQPVEKQNIFENKICKSENRKKMQH